MQSERNRDVIKKTGKCRACGIDVGSKAIRCKGCATRERNRLKRANREKHEVGYVDPWRCSGCGAKIRTEVCFGCQIEKEKQERKLSGELQRN